MIDDEYLFLETIHSKIKSQFELNGLSCLIDLYTDAKLLNLCKKYDVYFLDIEMPKIDGFQLATQIKKVFPLAIIVFITVKSELVYESYKVHPFDFIRKELLDISLNRTIDEIIDYLNIFVYQYEYKKRKMNISIKDIIYIEKHLNYIFIYIYEGSKKKLLKQRKTISKVYEELNNNRQFFIQINESTIVNIKFILSIKNNECRLIDNTLLYISRGYLPIVHKMYYTILR